MDLNRKLFEALGGKVRLVEGGGVSVSRAGTKGTGCSFGHAMYNAGFPDLTIEYGPLFKLCENICRQNNVRLEVTYDTLPYEIEIVTARFECKTTYVTKGLAEGSDVRNTIGLLLLNKLLD